MKKLRNAACILSLGLFFSCTDESTDGSSTPIDSTNVYGTAPATYGPDDPNSPDYPRYEGRYDTGVRAGAATAADSNTDRLQGH